MQRTGYDIERERIRNYAQGFNDAMRGIAPRSINLAYALGYADARR